MYSGRLRRRCARSASASASPTTYATSRCSPGASSRASDRALAHARVLRAARASISPGSMRKPRIFTWWSSAPQELQRRRPPASAPGRPCGTSARPASAANGSGTKRSAVSPGAAQVAARHAAPRPRTARRRRPRAPARRARPARRRARCAIGRPMAGARPSRPRDTVPEVDVDGRLGGAVQVVTTGPRSGARIVAPAPPGARSPPAKSEPQRRRPRPRAPSTAWQQAWGRTARR